MELATAHKLALRLLELWDPTGRGLVVGSILRRKPEVGDVDLLIPSPAEGAQVDVVHERMQRSVFEPGEANLFAEPHRDEAQHFDPVMGFVPGFKHTRLRCDTEAREGWPAGCEPFHVEVYRATLETPSNFGWIQIVRTGPEEHGRAVVAHIRRMGMKAEGGYLFDAYGQVQHTPTEQDAYRVLGLRWVEPWMRTDAVRGPYSGSPVP